MTHLKGPLPTYPSSHVLGVGCSLVATQGKSHCAQQGVRIVAGLSGKQVDWQGRKNPGLFQSALAEGWLETKENREQAETPGSLLHTLVERIIKPVTY